jgi:hypothetical protein
MAGDSIVFRPLGVLLIVSIVESWLQERRIAAVHKIAAGITDAAERARYYDEQTAKIPWGADLEKEAIGLMRAGEIPDAVTHRLLAEASVPPRPLPEIADLCHKATAEELVAATRIVLGLGVKKNSRIPRTSGRSRAPTGGRRA